MKDRNTSKVTAGFKMRIKSHDCVDNNNPDGFGQP